MSTASPALVAAAPALDAVLAAMGTFLANLGPDPTKLPVTLPGAFDIFMGTVKLQLPAVINAEWGVVQSDGQAKVAELRKALAAAITPPAPQTHA